MLPSQIPRVATDPPVRVFPGVWKLLFFKTPFLGRISVPTSFVSLFIFYILSYLLLKTMGCLSGCLMSSASIQKLFCGICSVFKCSFDEFVGEKVVSPSNSSTILGPSPAGLFYLVWFFISQFPHRLSTHQALRLAGEGEQSIQRGSPLLSRTIAIY